MSGGSHVRVTDPRGVIHKTYLERFDEVAIDIGRDGNLLFVDGRHRLTMAQLLELPSIPVRVVRRHAQWQQVRRAVAQGTTTMDHPDLHDVSGRT